MAPDYEAEMKAPVVRRKPAVRYTREATADRVAHTLVETYTDPKLLELILAAFQRRVGDVLKTRKMNT